MQPPRFLSYRHSQAAVVLLLLSSSAHAELVLHFDPNQITSQFGALGQTGVMVGDNVRWITDTRSPTPGGSSFDTWIDAEGNDESPVLIPLESGQTVWSFDGVGQRLLARRANTVVGGTGNQTGFGSAFDTNTLTAIVAGRIGVGGSGTDYLFDMLEGGSNVGFGMRYRFQNNELELNGFANQSVNPKLDLNPGEWFVATYAWNGAALTPTASLTIETATGSTTATLTAPSAALAAVSELRIGTRSGTSATDTRFFGDMGDLLIYNDAGDHSDVAAQLADEYFRYPRLVVNRETGNASISNPSSSDLQTVVGYSILSDVGTLNSSAWLSIADNYDKGSPGPNQVDPSNNWTELISAADGSELVELEFQGLGGALNGATFGAGDSTNLGNLWTRYYEEDIAIELLLDNGEVRLLPVQFVGNGGAQFEYGDLNFDGFVNDEDFHEVFKVHYGQSTSSLLPGPKRYNRGDMNEDGKVDFADFYRLKNAILAANPAAAALSFANPVPEGQSWMLFLPATVAVVMGRRYASSLTTTC